MMRHVLTLEEQIRGLENALANPRTPSQFIESLQFRLEKLKTQLERKISK
jgi:hypothetical protein